MLQVDDDFGEANPKEFVDIVADMINKFECNDD